MSRSKKDATEREISDLEKKIAERKALVAKYIGYALDLLKERFKTTEYQEFEYHTKIKKECRDFPEFDFYFAADYSSQVIRIDFCRGGHFSTVFTACWQENPKTDARVSVFSPDTDWQDALEEFIKNKSHILKEIDERQKRKERESVDKNKLEGLKRQASQLGL